MNENPDGYEILDITHDIIYFFETYTDMINEFGESIMWDFEEEMYIIQYEEEDDIIEYFYNYNEPLTFPTTDRTNNEL